MTEQIQEQTVAVEAPKELTTLERIHLLANLANCVEDAALKDAFLNLAAGDQLYHIFVDAVSKEIESMMNPAKAAPKELVDTMTIVNNLRNQMLHMHNTMVELNRAPLIGVLSVLNTSIGGKPIQQPNNDYQQSQQQQPPQQQADSPAPRNVTRSSNTGITW